MRKLAFSARDATMLKFFIDQLPVMQFPVLGNSSQEFQREPLFRSSVRMAVMTYFNVITSATQVVTTPSGTTHSEPLFTSYIDMATIYANFRHFTALGTTIEAEANRALKSLVDQVKSASFRKSLLESSKDAVKKQNKALDDLESRYLSAAAFFVQDAMFERCTFCIKQLQLLGVQKKMAMRETIVLGLNKEQAASVLLSITQPEDLLAVANGYDITSVVDWAQVLHHHVVLNGRYDVWAAYKAHTVSVAAELSDRLKTLAKNADLSREQKQHYAWLQDELPKPR